MEMGLIHPPVGRNIFVIRTSRPTFPCATLSGSVLPFVGLMFVAIVLICLFPGIANGFLIG